MSEQTVTPAQFKVGQVVMMKSLKRPMPFTILSVVREEGMWFYQWNRKNYAAEHMLRALTPEEMGR